MTGKNGNAEIRADIKLGNVTRSAFIPYSFSGLENIIKDVVLSFDAVELNCGQSTKTNLAIVRMDGTLVDVSQVEVYYDSSDTRVAEVDQQGNIYAKRSAKRLSRLMLRATELCDRDGIQ